MNTSHLVLELITKGQASAGVARSPEISVRTVDWHLEHLYCPLGVASRSEAVGKVGCAIEDIHSGVIFVDVLPLATTEVQCNTHRCEPNDE